MNPHPRIVFPVLSEEPLPCPIPLDWPEEWTPPKELADSAPEPKQEAA